MRLQICNPLIREPYIQDLVYEYSIKTFDKFLEIYHYSIIMNMIHLCWQVSRLQDPIHKSNCNDHMTVFIEILTKTSYLQSFFIQHNSAQMPGHMISVVSVSSMLLPHTLLVAAAPAVSSLPPPPHSQLLHWLLLLLEEGCRLETSQRHPFLMIQIG